MKTRMIDPRQIRQHTLEKEVEAAVEARASLRQRLIDKARELLKVTSPSDTLIRQRSKMFHNAIDQPIAKTPHRVGIGVE